MTLAMLANQAAEPEDGKSIDKWKLYRALCAARARLGVTDRALALLNALLTFYPKNELSNEYGLIVFPSNAQLSVRAHGMAEQTIRRHMAVLVETGLISRKDSANGKRFARRDASGAIDDAYGFNLAPLLARADEIEMLAADAVAEQLAFKRMRERFTICRRDVAKLIATAVEEGAAGNWDRHHMLYRGIISALPRSPSAAQVASALDEMELLRDGIVNLLKMQIKTENFSGNDFQFGRHIQNSKPDSNIELEPRFEKKQGEPAELNQQPSGRTDGKQEDGGRIEGHPAPALGAADLVDTGPAAIRSFPLGLVLRACPQIADYGPAGNISSWRDLMVAAVVVRSMLGVSPSAYQEACEVMGAENAATIMACILEKGGHINSAGGYLRSLTGRAKRGEFSLGPVLMALMRAAGQDVRRAG